MSFKCLKCGHIFEEGEEKTYIENYGEPGGKPYLQWFGCCPLCGGEYEETKQCVVCGSEHLKDELYFCDVCENCKDDIKFEYKYRPDLCYKLAEKGKRSVSINPFLADMFTEEQINEILFKELISSSSFMPVNCEAFIEADEYWFIENAIKEVGK